MVPDLTILSTVVVTVLPYLENDICNIDILSTGSKLNLSGEKTHAGIMKFTKEEQV